jgi:hypothetical protein
MAAARVGGARLSLHTASDRSPWELPAEKDEEFFFIPIQKKDTVQSAKLL